MALKVSEEGEGVGATVGEGSELRGGRRGAKGDDEGRVA